MSNAREYIAKLTRVRDDMDSIIEQIVLEHEGQLLATVKLRLFQKSLDGNFNFLGTYSDFTKKKKRAKGQISNRVTLRDTGTWYNSMFISFKDQEIIVESTDYPKTDELFDIYGEAILELTETEIEDFVDTVLDPGLEEHIDMGDVDFGTL